MHNIPVTRDRAGSDRGSWRASAIAVIARAAVIPLAALAASCSSNESVARTFTTSTSPDGAYEIVIKVIDPWSFGAHTVLVYMTKRSTGESVMVTERRLANDGGNLTSRNLAVRWLDRSEAQICLAGDEQKAEGIRVHLSKVPSATVTPACL